ncbi:hypothetical protein M3J09_001758 [Ascochyta lentis]
MTTRPLNISSFPTWVLPVAAQSGRLRRRRCSARRPRIGPDAWLCNCTAALLCGCEWAGVSQFPSLKGWVCVTADRRG